MLAFCERVVRVSRSHYLPARNRGIPVPKQPTTIGGQLRRRRLQLQIRQSEAAARLKVSTITLSRWECDKVYPTWDHHPALIEYLGCDPFRSCVLRDPYGNEFQGVASLSSATLGNRIRARRLEFKSQRAEIRMRSEFNTQDEAIQATREIETKSTPPTRKT
jgi:transcriptional regulator with XRE-family HTH domain